MNGSWKKLLSIIMAVAMVLTVVTPSAFAADEDSSNVETLDVSLEKVENNSSLAKQAEEGRKVDTATSEPEYDSEDVVRVSIMLLGKSAIQAGYSTKNIGTNAAAQNYRSKLKAEQDKIAQRISKEVLGGEKLDVVWNLTLAANLMSANVEYGKIDAIKNVIGVKDVILETRYEPAVASKDELDPNMSVASGMTGGQISWENGYTGAGQAVAIIDTGIDTDHQSFDPAAYEYSLSELNKSAGITKEDVAAVLENLNVYDRYKKANDGTALTVDDVYINAKVPFAFNYIDNDLDVTHDNDGQGEHGSHVSGIAAANRYIPDGENEDGSAKYSPALTAVKTQGEAPDAQILAMKVFGKAGGAYDSDYMVAIEDSVMLNAASTNLSLGSAVAGFANATNEAYLEILNEAANSDLVLAISAGNAYSWAGAEYEFNNGQGVRFGYLYSDDVNFNTVGSPGSYKDSLSVASVENIGDTGIHLSMGDHLFGYNENTDYGNAPLTTVSGETDFVYIDTIGVDPDANRNDFAVFDLTDKIAITNRGSSSFYMKANAAVEAGAKAVIIANNQAGTIGLNLTGYTHNAPVVSILQSEALYIKANAETKETKTIGEGDSAYDVDVYYGKIYIPDASEITVLTNEDASYTMGDYSSWGVPGDLSLKPEIAAPGGNIYSVDGAHAETDKYENMSGTSMAAPQIAGLAALMAQYIEDNGLKEKTGLTTRQLVNSLFMSTAMPLEDSETDYGKYYSVFKQGAGIVQLDKAMSAKTYIMMDEASTASAADGKVKAEIGEVGDTFEIGFNIYNITDEDIDIDLRGDFFTQDRFDYYTYDADNKPIADADGYPVVSEYLDTLTVDIDASIKWYVNGIDCYNSDLDINGDGTVNEKDATDLLEYIVGNVTDTAAWNLDTADVDKDGDIDTYDAYLILASCKLTVPAGGEASVKAVVTLGDLWDNSYVEGYIFAKEADSKDGAIGVEHSIPVLGFYGDWSAASMFDKGSLLEYEYGDSVILPYMTAPLGADAQSIQTFIQSIGGDLYYFGGNPIMSDTDADGNPVYLPERDAINSKNTMYGVRYSQIRNAGAGKFTVTNEAGEDVIDPVYTGPSYQAYYYVNGQEWRDISTITAVNVKPLLQKEGTKLTYSYTLAPEYYVASDGSVDWDSLSENATISASAVIDNTAPEVKQVMASREAGTNENGDKVYTYNLSLELLDNEYIAAAAVMDEANYKAMVKGQEYDYIQVFGSDIEAEKNSTLTYELSYSDEEVATPGQLLLEVYDYALNQTTYKINLSKAAQLKDEESYSLEFVEDYVVIVNSGTAQLAWIADPWGVDELKDFSISFTSSDESVATVDENGLVTAVSKEDSECIITATMTYKDFTASAECIVEIKIVEKDLNAVIWDEEGIVNFAKFNLKTIPDFERIVTDVKERPATVAIDPVTGDAYAATFDTEEWASILYSLDTTSYKLTEIGDPGLGIMDMAPAPGISEATDGKYLIGLYGPYVVILNAETGSYEGVFNFQSETGGNYFVGIAFEETLNHPSYGATDWYFLVDEAGTLYSLGLLPYNGSFANFDLSAAGSLGASTDSPYFNSLYMWEDAETGARSLVWACFNEGKGANGIVDMILVDDIYGGGGIYNIGGFADGVWPVGGIYEPVDVSGDDNEDPQNPGSAARKNAIIEAAAPVAATTEIESIKVKDNDPAVKGGLNAAAASVNTGKHPVLPEGVEKPENGETYTSSDFTNVIVDEDTHNGLVEITYDPEAIEISEFYDPSLFFDYVATNYDFENGKLKIAFISLDAISKDELITSFVAGVSDTVCETELTVDMKEINNKAGESVTITYLEHTWGEPEWTWADDLSTATATFTCEKCGETVTVDAVVTNDGDIYTATVTGPDDEEYTDEQEKAEAMPSYVMSYNVTLSGELYLNAYVVFNESVLSDENAYISMTYTDASDKANPKTVTENKLIKDADISISNGIERRIFSWKFFTAQLHDELTIQLHAGDGSILPLNRLRNGVYSDVTSGCSSTPWEYLEGRIANSTNPNMVELAKAIEYYGTAAQMYFKYNTSDIPSEVEANLEKAISASSIDSEIEQYAAQESGNVPSGITKITSSLLVEADHSLVYHFYLDGSIDIDKYTFKIDDEEVVPVYESEGKYCLTVKGIPSGELSNTHTFSVNYGNETKTITASALSYACGRVLKSTNPDMVRLAKALYLYSMAANKYFGSND